jgi:hypothetical protein
MNNFDWVTARSECSIVALFESLKAQLQEDVERRNGMYRGRPPFQQFGFQVLVNNTQVSVIVDGQIPNIYDSVIFELTKSAIEVRDKNGNLKFKATPMINDDGECRLNVNGAEKELWHIRKMALEDLLFREY